ncbi:hypothetical protein [Methylophaga sp.]|nr:hypothetical protein [Methylophaga sp.]|tara:strand:- start:9155 stop:9304 length:150 start_codon:yes stop_codon:yes gene_type:complete
MNEKQINKYIDFILNKSKNPKKEIQYLIYLISDTEYFENLQEEINKVIK